MTNLTTKTLIRTVKSTFGRFFAILAIVALGVGFFAGLKNAEPSMKKTADAYLREQKMYDLQCISTLGLTEEDIAAFADSKHIKSAEGGYKVDALAAVGEQDSLAYQMLSLPEKVALPKLTEGRMPQNDDECLADAKIFTSKDIGAILHIDGDEFSKTDYIIVGLVQSPRFISSDRGNTSVGSGELAGFFYLPQDAFTSEVYHEALLLTQNDELLFSDEYDSYIEKITPTIEILLTERADARFENVKTDAEDEISDAQQTLDDGRTAYNNAISSGIPAEMLTDTLAELQRAEAEINAAKEEVAALGKPTTYVLDMQSNSGCATFKNDIVIVDGIANAFPLFFVLIAALICTTTMTRMVNDERTQIGTLKALGYSDLTISCKYVLYALLASAVGCVGGYFLGTMALPKIIWAVYTMSYGFAKLNYYFDTTMFGICLLICIVGSFGVTIFACYRELSGKPAELIRPKTPDNGKRVLLERITPIWKHLSFLNKVTLRNAFRYKKRMLMMLLGIGGCTALIVTGFGIKDSVANITSYQYDEILYYDATVSFEANGDTEQSIRDVIGNQAEFTFTYREDMNIRSESGEKEATMIATSAENAATYFSLHTKEENIAFPQAGEAVVSTKLATQLNVKIGDTIFVSVDSKDIQLQITGICENFLNHYVYISSDTLSNYHANSAFVLNKDDESMRELITRLRNIDGVNFVSLTADEREIMDQSMASMNYIVVVVIVCAGTLAFIVLYNLTNINIMERIREVATIKVLGFRSSETASYVLRENILLSCVGGLLGLGLGKLLHWYVMMQVQVDSMTFDLRITVVSYLISYACTVVFAIIANLTMRIKLERVNMAESLKSVE